MHPRASASDRRMITVFSKTTRMGTFRRCEDPEDVTAPETKIYILPGSSGEETTVTQPPYAKHHLSSAGPVWSSSKSGHHTAWNAFAQHDGPLFCHFCVWNSLPHTRSNFLLGFMVRATAEHGLIRNRMNKVVSIL